MIATERPLLAIVPARGASKGIPRKNLRPVAGVPLLLRTLRTLAAADVATRLVVSTEDAEIAGMARMHGFEVVDRPAHLAGDDVPLADVVRQVVEALSWDGDVLLAQPTCPLLTKETTLAFTQEFRQRNFAWAIAGAPDAHIVWQRGAPLVPRVNRQLLAAHPKCVLRESGALQMMTARFAASGQGTRDVIEIPADEALDIDTYADLRSAELALGRKTVEFRVVASDEKGAGHLFRCLQLSDALSHHRVRWDQTGLDAWALNIVCRRGFEVVFPGWDSLPLPDVLVVDCLDAAETVVPYAKACGVKVALFEHDGPARRYADAYFDEFEDPSFAVLRPEFLCLPDKSVRERADRVLVVFGGTDPAGLNERVGSMLAYALDAEVRVVAGPAAKLTKAGNATVIRDAHMAEQMMWADLVITGAGRTVAEAVACGTPVVSLPQNERESRHASIPGTLRLPLWAAVSDEALIRAVSRLLDRPALRAEMVGTARGFVDGRGCERVAHVIEGLLKGL
jgi:CMP-N-acetylneuraminic acid synthetase/spore coat polysaccharide biosynthesis predicted glycosyltransferase SpsG